MARRDRTRRAVRLPPGRQESRLQRHRRADAGARHRGQHRDFQRDRCRAFAQSACPRTRRASCREDWRPRAVRQFHLALQRPFVCAMGAHRTPAAGVHPHRRMEPPPVQPRRRRREAAGRGDAGQRPVLRDVGCHGLAGTCARVSTTTDPAAVRRQPSSATRSGSGRSRAMAPRSAASCVSTGIRSRLSESRRRGSSASRSAAPTTSGFRSARKRCWPVRTAS